MSKFSALSPQQWTNSSLITYSLQTLFIANTQVIVSKDIQEPIRCNKCQGFGHTHNKCSNPTLCTYCTKEHKNTICPTPKDLHCVSCGIASNHASYNCKCPHFLNQAANLNSRLPNNSMPLFPTINQPWTFVTTPKKNPDPPPPLLPQTSSDTTPNYMDPARRTQMIQSTLNNTGSIFDTNNAAAPCHPNQEWFPTTTRDCSCIPSPPHLPKQTQPPTTQALLIIPWNYHRILPPHPLHEQ